MLFMSTNRKITNKNGCVKVMEAFRVKVFYTVGALKINRIIFPSGIKQQISQFARFIHKTDPNVSLVTVGKRQNYVYRYVGNLNELYDAVVLISFPKKHSVYLVPCAPFSALMPLPLHRTSWTII